MTAPYVVWDVETTIRTSYKRKANPFDPENYIVMSGWQRGNGPVVGEYFGRISSDLTTNEIFSRPVGDKADPDWFIKLIEPPVPEVRPAWLVGQNIKFDLLYALRDPRNLEAWMRFVESGGNVWDCQLAEYLLSGMAQHSHMMSMDEMAPIYGGNVKFDEVKLLWDAGVSTEDIDPDLLRTYLCGSMAWKKDPHRGWIHGAGEHGDIGNTQIIFLGQLARAEARGQMKSITMNMGSLLCTVEMERNGMMVDKALGLILAEKIASELADLTLELNKFLPPELPFDFKWSSRHHKSALIFGGKVKYEYRHYYKDAAGKQLYTKKKVTAVYGPNGGMMPLDKYLARVAAGAADTALRSKSGRNAGEYRTKQIEVDDREKPKSAMKPTTYEFPRMTEPSTRWSGAEDGVWSVAADVLKALANRGIPFLESLAKVEGLAKDLGTYYQTMHPKTGEMVGMLTLVQATGIIHHMLNHTSTVTARFSSSNPNLQNLPKEGKSLVKSLFISRFKGGKIIQTDFTALEVYIQAILTKSKNLIADLQAGLDMHCVRLSQKTGKPYEEVLLLCKGDQAKGIPADPAWDKMRTKAKIFSFQRAYGAGATLIAEETGMDIAEVKELIAAEGARYPEVDAYYEQITREITSASQPTNKVSQHPDFPALKCHFRKSGYTTPDGKRYSYIEKEAPKFLAEKPKSKGGCTTSFSPTEIKNYVVQGGGGEWAKAAMWLAVRVFYRTKNMGGEGLLVNQVHDALYADASDKFSVTVAAMLHACMDEASTFMEYYFGWYVPVPVPSESKMGDNMMDEKNLPLGFKDRVWAMRLKIRALYMDNYVPKCEKK